MTLLVVVGIVGVLGVVGYVATLQADETGEMTGVRRGIASGFDITTSMSRMAMWSTTVQTRPLTRCWPWWVRGRGTRPTDLGVDLGWTSWLGKFRRRLMASFESVVLAFGPPGSGKSALLARVVRDAPGPVVAASTAIDLWKHSHQVRAELGPVWVLNTEKSDKVQTTGVWPIVPGCEDPDEAMWRAGCLIGGSSLDALKDQAFWEGHAHRTLYCLLMAAALDGASMLTVAGWANDLRNEKRPHRILEHHKSVVPEKWSNVLKRWHDARSEKLVEGVESILQPTLEFMSVPRLAACVLPRPGAEEFDAEKLIRNRGSLYIIAHHKEQSPSGPLTAALAGHLYATATRLGTDVRLDPPLGKIVDEPAHTCRLPLPEWAATARKHGIFMLVGFQARSQLRETWGNEGAETIWDSSVAKVAFNSITDNALLRDLSELSGTRVSRLNDRIERVPVFTPHDIEHQPDGDAILFYKNKRPVPFTPEPVWVRGRKPDPVKRQRAASTSRPANVDDLSDRRAAREQREAS